MAADEPYPPRGHREGMSLWVTSWTVRSSEKERQAGGKSQSQLPSHPTADPQ